MDQATLDRLRQELEDDRSQQLEQLEEWGADPYSEDVEPFNLGSDGFADSAQATGQRSEALGFIEAARNRVHAIDEALQRMDEGSYGTCATCGEAIPVERLEARPFSIECVACAQGER